MKNFKLLYCLFAILVSGCSQDELMKNTPSSKPLIFTASFENNGTRTYLESGQYLRWTEKDQLSIFGGNTYNQQYEFTGKTGDNSGTFEKVSGPSYITGNDLDCHYAVYPYDSKNAISERGVITAILPSEQSYAIKSFGLGDNTMVAVTKDKNDTFLKFKNTCGYLELNLYGDDVIIKTITMEGNSNEKIAGEATITPIYGENPIVSITNNATETITLDCGENGVRLGTTAENATTFMFVVPPTIFTNGFSITITDVNGGTFTKSTSNEIVIERNVIKPMNAFEVEKDLVFPESLLLPDHIVEFSKEMKSAINNLSCTKVKFVTKSSVTSETVIYTDVNQVKTYAVQNGDWLELHTLAKEYKAGKSLSGMFSSLEMVTEINMEGLNTSNVTDMSGMFVTCSSLRTLNISNLNTSSVTNMLYMFSDCSRLTNLDVSSFNTSSVTNMYRMFTGCMMLTSLDLSNFNTSAVTNMQGMFAGCMELKSLDISNFNTTVVEDMSDMFSDCRSLKSLDLRNFNTSAVTNMQGMFAYCESLTSLNLSNFNTSAVTNMISMFNNCRSLTSLDLRNFNTSAVTNMQGMFTDCISLTSLNLSSFDTSEVTNMTSMFEYCQSLTSLNLSNFNTSAVTSMISMFEDCFSLKEINLSGFTINECYMDYMFNNCTSLDQLDLSSFNFASWVRRPFKMFYNVGCNSINKPINIYVSVEGGLVYLGGRESAVGIDPNYNQLAIK